MAEERLIKEGIVSEVNDTLMMARVTFEDKDNVVSEELAIVGQGSSSLGTRHYWLPTVGEQAVCLCAPNDDESGSGWIIGTRYNEQAPPVGEGQWRLRFANGTTVEFDDEDLNITVAGDFNMKVVGNINIVSEGTASVKATTIYLNE